MLREQIFDIVTDPPCHRGRNLCEFWDYQGHYCFLRDMHQDTRKCKLVGQFLNLFKAEVDKLTVIPLNDLFNVIEGKTWGDFKKAIVQAQLQHTKKQLLDIMGE